MNRKKKNLSLLTGLGAMFVASSAFACPDTNGDGEVNVVDLTAVILDWGTDGSGNNADVNGDGTVDVQDLTDVILSAALSAATLSQAMIAVGDDAVDIEEMAGLIAKTLGRSVRTIHLPLWPFYLAADLCTFVCRPLGIQPPIFRRRVDFYTKDRVFDNAKVRRLLDYEFRYDNERGVRETTNWYLENGYL